LADQQMPAAALRAKCQLGLCLQAWQEFFDAALASASPALPAVQRCSLPRASFLGGSISASCSVRFALAD
jgi:hypothetical protein